MDVATVVAAVQAAEDETKEKQSVSPDNKKCVIFGHIT